eukprot:scaffold85788_cov78-Phaeocystis_antarctica.AAC.1
MERVWVSDSSVSCKSCFHLAVLLPPQRRPACCAGRRIVVDVLASSRLPTILPLLAPAEFAVAE